MPRLRNLKRGGFSAAVTVIFITAAVLLNIIVNTVLDRFDVRVDLTERGLYSIEKTTAEYLGSLDDDIKIYFCSERSVFESLSNYGYYSQVVETAERFAESNDKFSIDFIDRLSDPTFSAKYGGGLTDTDVVIESGKTGRYRVVPASEYLVVDYYVDGQKISEDEAEYYYYLGYQPSYDVSSSSEQAFLSAIMSVTNLSPVYIAFTDGFGEGSITDTDIKLYATMKELLEKNSYITQTVNLFTADAVDPSVDFLVIYAPLFDYSADALDKIDKWLDNDGMYGKTLLFFPSVSQMPETPNLDSFLEEWGIRAEKGLIYQTNSSYASSDGYQQYIKATGRFSSGIAEQTLIGVYMRPITLLYEFSSSFTTAPILTGYDGTVFIPTPIPEEYGEDWEPDRETLNAGAISTKIRYDGLDALESHIIAIGSPYIFANYLEAEGFSNDIFLLNIFGDISGREEAAVYITPKSFRMTTFEITAKQADTIALVFVVIIPLVIIGTGLAVFFRRRYR